ncbi:cytochrome b/b6 domain-containing protein [Marinospirillum alkaliphilum]|uniref:Cytochrome b n=1 Tax=Marinospirillum alkaliphilum DSM 21637 TaxID=1122209 RepID=A0A1K1XMV3_9GAMM|nr:cytochrome b/b6 domain-containing protein [Marinospirillum alkaliphilum]SFX50413.1 Cytochrome b [Marinospirillum alkaliphilum DSM 21637]
MTAQVPAQNIKVWDWSIRVFHWSLPLLIFLLWFSQRNGNLEHHFLFGQVLTGLLVYRVIWGFIGTPYARFSHFLRGPERLLVYVQNFFSSDKPLYLSHNPLGGLMVLVLLGAVSFQLVTGLFTTDDIFFSGPLYDTVSRSTSAWMSRWHHNFFDWLLVLIGLHLVAILVYRLRGEGLVKAMFTGSKKTTRQPEDELSVDTMQAFPWLRFALAVVAALLVVLVIFHWV